MFDFLTRRFTSGRLRTRNALLEPASPRRGWPIDRAATTPGPTSPLGLDVTRRRAQAMVQTNAWAARAADVWPAALVGAGITVASMHPDAAVRARLQAGFQAWGLGADADGRLDWFGLQAAITRAWMVDGESFVHVRTTPDGLRLQLIPAELVDASLNRNLDGGGFVTAGIEFTASGERVAYHVLPASPNGFAPSFVPIRLPASDVLHIFRPLAVGQTRGIPWLAPCLLTLADLDGLLDALLVGARVSAMHAGFLMDMNGVGSVPYDGTQIGSVLESGLEPGTLKVLPSGFDIKFSSPQAATAGIELAKLNLRSIAMGTGLPEHVLSGDLAQANYSSLRAGLTEWRTRIEQLQYQILVPQLLRPVWERWIELASLAGELPEAVIPDLLRAEWYPPAQPWVDPKADAEAEATMIAAGLRSRRQAVAAQGYDVETLDAEIAADRAREAALGLSFSTTPKPGTPNAGT